jgi:bacterioferritin-associated ferredoxin
MKSEKMYVCHCDDVTLDEILETIGDRKFISVDEVKHTTRLGMGACRGKRCIRRLKQTLTGYGITVVGEATPRGPLSNQLTMGELYPHSKHEKIYINQRMVLRLNVLMCNHLLWWWNCRFSSFQISC